MAEGMDAQEYADVQNVYVAMDATGQWFAFNKVPHLGEHHWLQHPNDDKPQFLHIDKSNLSAINWRDSLCSPKKEPDIVLYKYKHHDLYCSALGGTVHIVAEKRMEAYLKVRKQTPKLTILVAASEMDDKISEFINAEDVHAQSAEDLIG